MKVLVVCILAITAFQLTSACDVAKMGDCGSTFATDVTAVDTNSVKALCSGVKAAYNKYNSCATNSMNGCSQEEKNMMQTFLDAAEQTFNTQLSDVECDSGAGTISTATFLVLMAAILAYFW